MILDAQLCFNTTAQAITGAVTTIGTDYIDVSAAIRPDEFRVSTAVSAVGGTTPTLTIELFGDTAATFASEKSVGSRAIAAADLVAGKVYHLDCPPTAPFRYYRVKYTQAGTAPTATVQSFLVDEDLVQTDILLAGVSVP
jgi:hypothetical protein